MHVGQLGLELLALQRLGQGLDLAVASPANHLDGRGMDTFKKKELDLAFVERGFAHGAEGC
jgi:hypothetical protein